MVDPKIVARRFKIWNDKERAELAKKRKQASEEGKRLARLILSQVPGTKVVRGFGSTWELWRDYRQDSDIDLAIEGGDILAALGITEQSSMVVEVLDLSACPPLMAELIRENGVILAGPVIQEEGL